MAVSMGSALATLRNSTADDLLTGEHFEQLCLTLGHTWRDRLFTPLLTLRLFLLQILHTNTSINHLRQLSGLMFTAGAYCQARVRLPSASLQYFLQSMIKSAGFAPAAESGPRIYLVDGSSFSMPDTPLLRDHFALPGRQKPGIGYPVCTIMGLLDVCSGLFTRVLALPLFTHDMKGVIGVHDSLGKGDILVGDRAFYSYAHFAVLNSRGVFGCFRLHQRRPTDRLGLVRWEKPQSRPVWMSAEQFASLPALVMVRIIRHQIVERGMRTQEVFIATTLPEEQWSDERVIALYARRWEIETCFNHLKTTMGMNVLKCQSVEGVMKELAVYMIVYNLVRLLMLKYARERDIDVRRVSFIDALHHLSVRALGLCGVAELIINPHRPGRSNPRVVRRRRKPYDLMTKPRSAYKTRRNWGEMLN